MRVITVNLPSPQQVAFHRQLGTLSDGGQASCHLGTARGEEGLICSKCDSLTAQTHSLIKYLGPREPCLQY